MVKIPVRAKPVRNTYGKDTIGAIGAIGAIDEARLTTPHSLPTDTLVQK
jgi:hypothetical protein